MATFDITQNAGDSHQVMPYWLVAFLPLKNRASFDPSTRNSTQAAIQDPVGTEDLILADGDVMTVSTSSSKENHVSGASMTLYHDAIDYRQLVAPGDYVLIWMFDNGSDYARIRQALVSNSFGSGLNGPQDGFKFLGRVSSCRRKKTRQAEGKLITTYSVAANGFTEMDSTQYFNPLLRPTPGETQPLAYLANFGVDHENILTGLGLSNSQILIPSIVQICLGFGPGAAAAQVVPVTDSLKDTDPDGKTAAIAGSMQNQISPNMAYQIPVKIWEILGSSDLPTIKNGHPSYADILRTYIGIHDYVSAVSGGGSGLQDFVPAFGDTANGVFYSDKPLQGILFPPRLDFNMQTLWAIAKTLLNEPVNEMYTCLRLDPTNHVMPTLMIRQMPFTSQNFQDNLFDLSTGGTGPAEPWSSTPYLSIPRWVIDDSMIYDEDTGRTDATRANFVHVTGSDSLAQDPNVTSYISMADAPPIVDSADIFRSGLRVSEHPLATALDLQSQTGVTSAAARFYTQFFADTMINGQLKYQGTAQCNGIQAPICEGDNAVIGGNIYHIERIEHTAGFSDVNRGTRYFMTTLSLTHGVDVLSDADADGKGLFVYPGDSGDVDTQTNDPGVNANSDGAK